MREVLGVKNPAYKYYGDLHVYRYEGVGQVHIDIDTLPKKHASKKLEIRARCAYLKGFLPSFVASDELSIPQKAFHDNSAAYRELRTLFEVIYVGKTAYVNINKFKFDYGIPKDAAIYFVHHKELDSYRLENIEIRKITKNYFLVLDH